MERLPFAYVALALVFGLLVLGMWLAAYLSLRKPPSDLTTMDKAIGFMLLGPAFGPLHAKLSARGYRLTVREKAGLVFVLGVVAVIVIGSVINGYLLT